jgi:hypothetical protein
MSIKENVVAVKMKMLDEIAAGGELSFTEEVKTKALRAINGGATDWVTYMRLFADTEKPQQLARLIPTDGTENDSAMRDARAYLVAAATCTPITTTHFEEAIGNALDEGLQD